MDLDHVSRLNGSFVAKGLCNFVGTTEGLSTATTAANAWRAAIMAALPVLLASVICLWVTEQSLRLLSRRLLSLREVLMMR